MDGREEKGYSSRRGWGGRGRILSEVYIDCVGLSPVSSYIVRSIVVSISVFLLISMSEVCLGYWC